MTEVTSRLRLNIYLEYTHAKQLHELSALKGVSKSSIVAAALASFLSPDGQDRREAALTRRLDRLANQFERLERDQTILVETLALFIRYELSVSAAIPEAQQEAVRAQGKARFEKFIEQLARHLQRGGSLVKEVHQEIYPDKSHSLRTDDADSTSTHSTHNPEVMS
jgi:hypothetical protein